jgi:hypothetical protein
MSIASRKRFKQQAMLQGSVLSNKQCFKECKCIFVAYLVQTQQNLALLMHCFKHKSHPTRIASRNLFVLQANLQANLQVKHKQCISKAKAMLMHYEYITMLMHCFKHKSHPTRIASRNIFVLQANLQAMHKQCKSKA